MRMDAHYYSFIPTGNVLVDKILSAVACAGKAYQHTVEWGDEAYGGAAPSPHTGPTPVDWMQNAANEAAAKIAALVEALEVIRDADRDCHADGLRTLPPPVRAKIDKALELTGGA